MIDQKYNIQLEVITPLSVGAGNDNDWVKAADFVQHNDKLYVLDLRKIIEYGFDRDRLNQYFINQDEDGICRLLGNHLEMVAKYVFSLPTKTDNPVKTFLRTQLYDRPLVPGSSIKGSVRSALFNYLRDEETSNEEVFGTMKQGDDFMRFLKIGDVEMGRTMLINTKLFNLQTDEMGNWMGGWKHGIKKTSDNYSASGFNTLYECVPPGEKGIGTIIMAAETFQRLPMVANNRTPHADKKKDLMNKGIKEIFRIINNVTRSYLVKEQAFFKEYNTERTEDVSECINSLIKMIPDDNSSCLLKMSAGVGFHSITGNWKYDSFIKTGIGKDGKKRYKSRKIAEYNGKLMLMGFVKIGLIPEEEIKGKQASAKLEHMNILENIRTAPERRASNARRMEEERIAKDETEKKKQQIQKEYEELIESAKRLYFNNRNKEAMEIAQKAEIIWPEGYEHKKLMDDISASLVREKEREKANEDRTRLLSQPLSTVLKGKTSIGNILGYLTKWVEIENHSFGEEETRALAESFAALSNKEFKKLKGSQKRIISIIGEEYAISVIKKAEEEHKNN